MSLKRFKALIGPTVGVIAFPVFYQLVSSGIRAKRLLHRSAQNVLHRDKRPPVVFLRSFNDDGSGRQMPTRNDIYRIRSSDEEQLAKSLRCVGPVIAIGRPGEALPETGAHRMCVSDDEWQVEVQKLVDAARLVVVRTGTTEGLLWELQTVVQSVSPDRIIIYNEPPACLTENVRALLPADIPSTHDPARFIAFDTDWTVRYEPRVKEILKAKQLYRIQLRSILFWTPITLVIVSEFVILSWVFYQVRNM